MTQPTPQSGAPASRDIVIGATVYGHDNARFGSVAGSYRDYLIVERGFFMPVDYYIPMAAIERADRDLVVLTVSRDAALTKGWERPPFTSETGQRGLRQPAVGRPASAPGTPAAGSRRAAGAGTGPTSWPTAAGDQTSSPDSGTSPGGDREALPAARQPATPASTADRNATTRPVATEASPQNREGTAISPGIAFADTYAIGTNTDSYHAFVDPNVGAGPAGAGSVTSPPLAQPVAGQPSGDGSSGGDEGPEPEGAPGASSGESPGGTAKPGQ